MPCESQIDKVLNALSRLPCADKVMVFGSTARGAADPHDVDAVIDMRPLTRKAYLASDPGGAELQPLLNISHNLYGWFDPFLRFANEDLLVRNDQSTRWVKSENRRELLVSIDAEARTLRDVIALRQSKGAAALVAVARQQARRTP